MKSLREKALAATKGPWEATERDDAPHVYGIDPVIGGWPQMSLTNADYIAAASPDVILELLDLLEGFAALANVVSHCADYDGDGTIAPGDIKYAGILLARLKEKNL